MADILYTTKSGTEGYTGVTTDTWFQIINERNNMAVDFAETNTPQINPTDYSPKSAFDDINARISFAQDRALNALNLATVVTDTYIEPKSVYVINDTTGNTIYNLTETYDRIYLVNNTALDGNEIILPDLAFFKDNQKLVFASHPDSIFKAKISWYDNNGIKNYVTAEISKDNSLEFDYWEDVGTMVIKGAYTGYTFDENYFVGFKTNADGYSIAKFDKTHTLIWSKDLTTGMTTNISSDNMGNIYVSYETDGTTFNKLDAFGNELWSLPLGVTVNRHIYRDNVIYLSTDAVYNTIDYGNINLAAYGYDSTLLWGSSYPGTVNDLALSNDGLTLYVVGAPTGGTYALKVYDSQLGYQITEYDITGRTSIDVVEVLSDGNIVFGGADVSGYTHEIFNTVTGGTIAYLDANYTINDIVATDGYFYTCGGNYVTKYANDGTFIWESATHGNDLKQISLDANGDIYAVGDIQETYIGRIFSKVDGSILDDIPADTQNATAIYVK